MDAKSILSIYVNKPNAVSAVVCEFQNSRSIPLSPHAIHPADSPSSFPLLFFLFPLSLSLSSQIQQEAPSGAALARRRRVAGASPGVEVARQRGRRWSGGTTGRGSGGPGESRRSGGGGAGAAPAAEGAGWRGSARLDGAGEARLGGGEARRRCWGR